MAATRRATLLVVDDDPIIRGLIHQLFGEKYECSTADRAEQALEYLEVQNYDAIITDVFMPGLSGIQILQRIRELHLTTPVIFISGKSEELQESFIGMGAFAFLSKPFTLELLEATVSKAIAHHQLYREGPGGA